MRAIATILREISWRRRRPPGGRLMRRFAIILCIFLFAFLAGNTVVPAYGARPIRCHWNGICYWYLGWRDKHYLGWRNASYFWPA